MIYHSFHQIGQYKMFVLMLNLRTHSQERREGWPQRVDFLAERGKVMILNIFVQAFCGHTYPIILFKKPWPYIRTFTNFDFFLKRFHLDIRPWPYKILTQKCHKKHEMRCCYLFLLSCTTKPYIRYNAHLGTPGDINFWKLPRSFYHFISTFPRPN